MINNQTPQMSTLPLYSTPQMSLANYGGLTMPPPVDLTALNFQTPAADPSLANLAGNNIGGPGTSGSGMPFFTEGNSMMQNFGEGIGLAGATLSLADMLNNWGMGKKMMKTNIANVNQQMTNNQEAFDRSKARQDRSLAAVNDANERAQQTVMG